MKVALIICDGGDGYSHIRYYKDLEEANRLCDDVEDFYANEDGPDIIEVPDDFSPPGGFSD